MGWATDTAAVAVEAFDGVFGVGVMVAGVAIDETGTAISLSDRCPADARFEIGSVTKTMTAVLLALLAGDGVLGLDDGIGRWLDAGPNGDITLRELATHTSGLPRLAPSHTPGTVNPYAYLTADVAEADLRTAVRRPDAGWSYSNFGYQLLGLALERAAGKEYPALLDERVLGPLGMTESGVGPAGDGTALPGYANGRQVTRWDQPLPGAGGVQTSAGDLARYLGACLVPPDSSLGAAIRLTQTAAVRVNEHLEIGLGWLIRGTTVWHTGGTGGFTTAAGLNRANRRAFAVLVNAWAATMSVVLESALQLALAGQDPRAARPRPAGPQWDERARTLATALIEGRFGEVHTALAAPVKAILSVERIEQAWRQAIERAGAPSDVSVSCHTSGHHVDGRVTITCAKAVLSLAVLFAPDGTIADVRVVPAEPTPL
jgi:CubicO group peptidase (beta-lactamase class C family)